MKPLATIVAAAFLFPSAGFAQRLPTATRLVLTETYSVPIPLDIPISGVQAAGPDSFLVWSSPPGWVGMLSRHGTIRTISEGLLDRPVGFSFVEDDALQAIQRDGHAVTLTLSGAVTSRIALPLPLDSVQIAVRWRQTWYLGGWQSQSSQWAVFTFPDSPADSLPLVTFEKGPTTHGGVIAAVDDGIAIAQAGTPHTAVTFRPTKARVVLDTPVELADSVGWITVATVHVSPGWLQIIADPRSDQRWFVTFDETGQQLRSSRVPVAVGVRSGGYGDNSLLGVRDIGSRYRELVEFKWRWDTTR